MDFLPQVIQTYSEMQSEQEPPLLKELAQITYQQTEMPQMLSGHLVGRFLAFLSRIIQPKLAVEIGTFTGYSALCIAEGLAPQGVLYTIDNNPQHLAIAKRFFEKSPLGKQIQILEGDAVAMLKKLPNEPIDFAFIDADKSNYVYYYDYLLPRMRKNGVIIVDNALWSGKVLDETIRDKETEGIRRFNKHVRFDKNVFKLLLPIRDGLYLLLKRS